MTGPALGMVLNRDAWNKFTPDQKKIHVKYAAWMSAKQAIGNFLVANEESLQSIVKEKGVQIVKTDPKDWEAVIGDFAKVDRERNIATAKGFGVADPAAIIDDYTKTVEKWRGLSKEIGRDVDKYTEVLMREILLEDRRQQALSLGTGAGERERTGVLALPSRGRPLRRFATKDHAGRKDPCQQALSEFSRPTWGASFDHRNSFSTSRRWRTG